MIANFMPGRIDLGDQLRDTCKPDLVAEPFDKQDIEGLPVDILIEVEDVDFDGPRLPSERRIEADIQRDFDHAFTGIEALPLKARFGVYVAYKYYLSLFRKIRRTEPKAILDTRIRIANYHKALIVLRAGVKNQLRLI